MTTALRTITRVRDADDVDISPDISQDGYALTYNHGAGNFVLAPGGASGGGGGAVDIGARVYHNANQNLPYGVAIVVAFNSERWDTDNIHDVAVNNSRLTCRTAGKYLVWTNLYYATSGDSKYVELRLNGAIAVAATYNSSNYGHLRQHLSTVCDLQVGDYVEVVVTNWTGGTQTLTYQAEQSPEFAMQLLAAANTLSNFNWDEAATEAGPVQNRTTIGSFSRQTGRITVYQPLKVTALKIDIAAAATYKLGLTVGNSATYAVTLVASKVVSAAGETTFTPDNGDYVLLPGTYFLTLESLAGSVNWHDRNVSSFTCELFLSDAIYYDDTSYNYSVPVRLVAYRGAATGRLLTPGTGRVLIGEQAPSGVNLVTWSGIPSGFGKLVIEGVVRSTRSGYAWDPLRVQFNGDTASANYRFGRHGGGSSLNFGSGNDGNEIAIVCGATSPANACAQVAIEVLHYAGTAFNKQAHCLNIYREDATSVHELALHYGVEWENTAAIHQIDLLLENGNFVAGTVFRLYGEH